MEHIKRLLIDSTSCPHNGDKYCESCKIKSVKVIIGGFTVFSSTVFGSLICIGSCINYYFSGFYDIELTLSLGFGCGALIGTMLGISLCVSSGLLNINEDMVKRAVEQSEKEKHGLYINALHRYNTKMYEYHSGKSRDYPTRPVF